MIELDAVERVFAVGDEEVRALDDVSLQIRQGEYVALMGPSGSGKSTMLNILGLLDRPTSGSFKLDGQDTQSLSDDERADLRSGKIGFVFQAFHLVPRLTAAENVELPLLLSGVDPVERRRRVAEALARLEMTNRADHRPDQLSGGQRQRVAIARSTIMSPEIILADEPTGNLDHKSGDIVVDTLETLNDQGITLIMVTHDPEIGDRARRRIRMVDGRVDTALPETS